jgi:AraC-like DNA-binding protein
MKNPGASTSASPDFFSTQILQARRFFLNLSPQTRNYLTVTCGGMEYCDPNYAIQRGSFPFYSIEFVARGFGRLRLGTKEHRLHPGSVFSYGPGVPHEISTDPRQPLIKYFVDFAGSGASALLKSSRLRAGSLAQVFPPTEIQPLFDELIRNGLRSTRQSPRICAILLEALAQKITEARVPRSGRETPAFGTYLRCRDHIGRHFQRLRSVEQIARECHLNNAYLCRLFKRYDEGTAYGYLTRKKMNYAAERLQSPSALVKQVAEETGFANQFHFSRVFKAVFGISPSAMSQMRGGQTSNAGGTTIAL